MKDRHAMVEVNCEWCGITFSARKERVDKGQSRWCSRPHYREWLDAQGSQRKNIGKENAIISWSTEGFFKAYWYKEDGKYTSTTWAKWAWELNFGEIPDGYRAGFRDGNPENNTVENLYLQSSEEFGKKLSKLSKGRVFTEEHKKALSGGRIGMKLSEEHVKHIGDATRKKWADGVFDTVHIGQNHARWRGGVKYLKYPKEYYAIRRWIIERDDETCQVCGKDASASRKGHVHHIDGNTMHNTEDNLILVCPTCHIAIHSKTPAIASILAFRSKLEWHKP